MITHDMRLVQEYAERVIVMSAGQIIYDGRSSSLFERADLLDQANLRRTILHNLLLALRAAGFPIQGDVRRTIDLINPLIQRQGVK
jgi:ABC-type dipeptide/oligopeptide/nickel transport system ATPase component